MTVENSTVSQVSDLFKYVSELGKLNETPYFKVEDYKQMVLWEHELQGKIGVRHDFTDDDGSDIWLHIERLERTQPPKVSDEIKEWIEVSNNPDEVPTKKAQLMKTVLVAEAEQWLKDGKLKDDDVLEPKREDYKETHKDVILKLENQSKVKKDIDNYINNKWSNWSKTEKPRRETIKLYHELFTLQQLIEAQSETRPLEVIWGVGVSRWNYEGRHKIDMPLIEKVVEIEVNSDNGSISIRPRNNQPELAIKPYVALKNSGTDIISRFAKKYFAENSDKVEFSPFLSECFEPVLRQSATFLSEEGTYWPDQNGDIQNRVPPEITTELQVTDSWLIYARPRSSGRFIQDIANFEALLENVNLSLPNTAKRLVTELSNEKPGTVNNSVSLSESSGSSQITATTNSGKDIYFPKPYNNAQVRIIQRLENNDGVVVQGPPGTGKTHTIANIICHYLASGKRVLVTSHGEPALAVLQDQMPEALRPLTISLLANEREGLKQLEKAINKLADITNNTQLSDLNTEVDSLEQRIESLKQSIVQTDIEIGSWGEKQLQAIPDSIQSGDNIQTAMALAEHVKSAENEHNWFLDAISSSSEFEAQFTDQDIIRLREARQKLGDNLIYCNLDLPAMQDMPDAAMLAGIHHEALNQSQKAEQDNLDGVPPLSDSQPDAVGRAKALEKPLQDIYELTESLPQKMWLDGLYTTWLNKDKDLEDPLGIEDLFSALGSLVAKRKEFATNLIDIQNPAASLEDVQSALGKLSQGKKAFGPFSLGNKEVKSILDNATINSEKPNSAHEWEVIQRFVDFQEEARRFSRRWNHSAPELGLPEVNYKYGSPHKELQDIFEDFDKAKNIAQVQWHHIKSELEQLFPFGLKINTLTHDKDEIAKALKAIQVNTAQGSTSQNNILLEDIQNRISSLDSPLTTKMTSVISSLGEQSLTTQNIMDNWNSEMEDLKLIQNLRPHFEIVQNVTEKIENSGAPLWAEQLSRVPVEGTTDILTPHHWQETWLWKRREQYLHEIDGHEELKALSSKRIEFNQDLERAFGKLVYAKTSIGLQKNMTERVQGALFQFSAAVSNIGKGTGKRAPRHRKDAYAAMEKCYEGVPCWIMPTWRVSEMLPAEFGSFDLVIIDEASQSNITALPAILRADKLLVVGDDRQVSPSGVGLKEDDILQLKHNFLKGQPFEQFLLPDQSIYNLAGAMYPSQRIVLREHFRCVEPIIRFSMQFYDEALIPLRLPKASERLTPPLIDVYVPHAMRDERKKINESEIDAIVEEIVAITNDKAFENRTIGVISLIGAQQAKAIQDRLLSELDASTYQRHNISCGDSATFQGKERDIMFLSMVVGPGQGIAMTTRPYEQRFNVALSRARDRMYLYRSIKESDLSNNNDLRLKVLRHFVDPMPNVKQVENALELCDSGFERDVFTRLTNLGYNVTPQVKVAGYYIDLVVEGELDRRLAVELDGDRYHGPEKWMEDWNRQRTMERVGWHFWRCWGSSYTLDPEGCIDDLVNRLNEMDIYPSDSEQVLNSYTESRIYEPEGKDSFSAIAAD